MKISDDLLCRTDLMRCSPKLLHDKAAVPCCRVSPAVSAVLDQVKLKRPAALGVVTYYDFRTVSCNAVHRSAYFRPWHWLRLTQYSRVFSMPICSPRTCEGLSGFTSRPLSRKALSSSPKNKAVFSGSRSLQFPYRYQLIVVDTTAMPASFRGISQASRCTISPPLDIPAA